MIATVLSLRARRFLKLIFLISSGSKSLGESDKSMDKFHDLITLIKKINIQYNRVDTCAELVIRQYGQD